MHTNEYRQIIYDSLYFVQLRTWSDPLQLFSSEVGSGSLLPGLDTAASKSWCTQTGHISSPSSWFLLGGILGSHRQRETQKYGAVPSIFVQFACRKTRNWQVDEMKTLLLFRHEGYSFGLSGSSSTLLQFGFTIWNIEDWCDQFSLINFAQQVIN